MSVAVFAKSLAFEPAVWQNSQDDISCFLVDVYTQFLSGRRLARSRQGYLWRLPYRQAGRIIILPLGWKLVIRHLRHHLKLISNLFPSVAFTRRYLVSCLIAMDKLEALTSVTTVRHACTR